MPASFRHQERLLILISSAQRPIATPPPPFPSLPRHLVARRKANGSTAQTAQWLNVLNSGKTAPSTEVVVAPPHPYLADVRSRLRRDFAVASQDAFATTGAHTGEVSASMLKDLGLKYAILGHSERRQKGETNELIAAKATAAIDNGLTVIACLGETLAEREAGRTIDVVTSQLAVRVAACAARICRWTSPPPPPLPSLSSSPHFSPVLRAAQAYARVVKDWGKVVVAYEPVWAIGTGKVASPAQAQEVHAKLRTWLHSNVSPAAAASTRIIYGGSVTGSNAKELASQADIDGFLVGGASLKPEFIDVRKGESAGRAGG